MSSEDDAIAERMMSMQLSMAKEEKKKEEEEEFEEEEEEAEDEQWLIDRIVSGCYDERVGGIRTLRMRTSDNCAPSYKRLVHSPALRVIVESLDDAARPELQLEAAWALTNLVSSQEDCADAMGQCGAVKKLLRLLSCQRMDIVEQACWAMSNLIVESSNCLEDSVSGGLPSAMSGLCDTSHPASLLDAVSHLMVNLVRECDSESRLPAGELLPTLCRLLNELLPDEAGPVVKHSQLTSHVMWSLSYIVTDVLSFEKVKGLGALASIRRALDTDDLDLLVPALRFYGNVAANVRTLPDCLFADGLLHRMVRLLRRGDPKIRRQIFFFATNVAAGQEAHLDLLVEAGILAEVGQALVDGTDGEKTEAFWVVSNFFFTRPPRLINLMVDECMDGFLNTLDLCDFQMTHCVLLVVQQLLQMARNGNTDELDFNRIKSKIERSGGLKKLRLAQKIDGLAELGKEVVNEFFLGKEKKRPEGSGEVLDEVEQVGQWEDFQPTTPPLHTNATQ